MNKVIKRPWGSFTLLQKKPDYWVKKLVVKPGQSTSLQYHKYRDEFWYVLSGNGEITYQTCIERLKTGDTWKISSFTLHRITNTGTKNLSIIEIATGKPRETDIIRVEDNYGRIGKENK